MRNLARHPGGLLTWASALVGAIALLAPAAARADVPCSVTEPGVIVVDGLLDDWSGVEGTRYGKAPDAGVTVRCNYDARTLYLVLDVADDRVVRQKKPHPNEDRLALTFGKARLEVLPGRADYGASRKVTWKGPGGAKVLKIADSLQPRGYSIELAMPLARVPGWRKGVPSVAFQGELQDADMLAEARPQGVVSFAGALAFQEGAELFGQFLEEQKLRRRDIRVDTMVDMDGVPGKERVVFGGRVVGILSDQYAYLTLPVQKGKDILDFKLADLSGTGRSSLVVRYVERGGGGSREVLAVFDWQPDGSFQRKLAMEVAKQLGTSKIANSWQLVPRKKVAAKGAKKGKGLALVVRAGQAVGFSAETWREEPAADMEPILLPWGDKKQATFVFDGREVFEL